MCSSRLLFPRAGNPRMKAKGLFGDMRVSKADGSQTVDLQRDALLGAGVEGDLLYEDHASGGPTTVPGWLPV